jgi:hypothetical protein
MSASSADPDVPRLIGLTGPGAWAMAGLFWATYLLLITFSGGPPMRTAEGWVAFLLTLGAAVVVVLPGRYPLRLPIVLGVLGVVVVATVAINAHLSPVGWPGWTSWQYGSNTFLMFMLALRGRVWWGALGIIVMVVLTMTWTWTATGDVWHGFDLTYRQFATYLAGSFFASWLRRTARQIVDFQSAEQRRVHEEQARESAAAERGLALERVRRIAAPALKTIASGRVSAEARREHGLLEAQLRDGIRGRALSDEGPLTAAVRDARTRGSLVALLDDLPRDAPVDTGGLDPARAWIVDRLAECHVDDVTVRVSLVDGDPVVTFAGGDGTAKTFTPRVGSPAQVAPDPPV